ncbi:transposase [Streptomyces nanhaiensis]|uniref:transposase n=1 Tax=Streptomyces nanhaiensis TaxID=679319 RepID=UPI00399CBE6F
MGEGDLIVVDAGYDVPRLVFLLRDLPVQVLGRMRSDRVVLRRAVPPCEPDVRGRPRPTMEGGRLRCPNLLLGRTNWDREDARGRDWSAQDAASGFGRFGDKRSHGYCAPRPCRGAARAC